MRYKPSELPKGGASTADGSSLAVSPPSRRRLVFAVVSIALFMASVDQTIVATALPALQHDLDARVNWSGWTITSYALGQVLMMPVAGKLSDQYGRKKVFLTAVVLFTVASLCCGLANDIYVLVVLRAVQALGGGAFMPSATGIVSDLWGDDRDRAIGLFGIIYPIGGICGPILGGILVNLWSWRAIFLVNVPVGLFLVAAGVLFIPRNDQRAQKRFDIMGVALLAGTLLPVMIAITYLGRADQSPISAGVLAPIAVSLIGAMMFIRHCGRTLEAFIPPTLLHGRGFGVMNLINFLFGSASLGFGALLPLYAQDRLGVDAFSAGTILTGRAIGMISVAGIAVYLLRRTGYRWPMTVGFLSLATGLVIMSSSPHILTPFAWIAFGAGVSGIGIGMSTPSSNNATLQLAPDSAAAIAGLRGMFRQAGGITGVAIGTAIAARSAYPGQALAHVFVAFAIVVVAVIPVIRLVPEHRGAW